MSNKNNNLFDPISPEKYDINTGQPSARSMSTPRSITTTTTYNQPVLHLNRHNNELNQPINSLLSEYPIHNDMNDYIDINPNNTNDVEYFASSNELESAPIIQKLQQIATEAKEEAAEARKGSYYTLILKQLKINIDII